MTSVEEELSPKKFCNISMDTKKGKQQFKLKKESLENIVDHPKTSQELSPKYLSLTKSAGSRARDTGRSALTKSG